VSVVVSVAILLCWIGISSLSRIEENYTPDIEITAHYTARMYLHDLPCAPINSVCRKESTRPQRFPSRIEFISHIPIRIRMWGHFYIFHLPLSILRSHQKKTWPNFSHCFSNVSLKGHNGYSFIRISFVGKSRVRELRITLRHLRHSIHHKT